jgi:phosphosulfolactate synthase
MPAFLDLPPRSAKPREQGITHVLDRGLAVTEIDGLIEVAGDFVDYAKLGWGTALATRNLHAKLDRYRAHGIPVVLGGTLTELAIAQRRLEGLVAWLHDLGLGHVEVSDGTIALDHAEKLALIERLAREFIVFSEVGSKDAARIMAPYRWVEQIETELEAGAWKVIAEARESGTAGIYRPDGEVRMGLIDEIAHEVDPARMVFEAPRNDQQVWFLKRFGPEVNLGNIPPQDVLSLETLRLGLRSDTIAPTGAEPADGPAEDSATGAAAESADGPTEESAQGPAA